MVESRRVDIHRSRKNLDSKVVAQSEELQDLMKMRKDMAQYFEKATQMIGRSNYGGDMEEDKKPFFQRREIRIG